MPNVTLSIEETLLKLSREYAQKHKSSLNALVRELLQKTVENQNTDWIEDVFSIMDTSSVSSSGETWNREDLYR